MFDLEELRKVATCVFLAAEAEVAEDIAGHIMDAADEIERLRANADVRTDAIIAAGQEIGRLRAALTNLHDWYVDYAKINNLFNSDGTPATFHELLEARKLIHETTGREQPSSASTENHD